MNEGTKQLDQQEAQPPEATLEIRPTTRYDASLRRQALYMQRGPNCNTSATAAALPPGQVAPHPSPADSQRQGQQQQLQQNAFGLLQQQQQQQHQQHQQYRLQPALDLLQQPSPGLPQLTNSYQSTPAPAAAPAPVLKESVNAMPATASLRAPSASNLAQPGVTLDNHCNTGGLSNKESLALQARLAMQQQSQKGVDGATNLGLVLAQQVHNLPAMAASPERQQKVAREHDQANLPNPHATRQQSKESSDRRPAPNQNSNTANDREPHAPKAGGNNTSTAQLLEEEQPQRFQERVVTPVPAGADEDTSIVDSVHNLQSIASLQSGPGNMISEETIVKLLVDSTDQKFAPKLQHRTTASPIPLSVRPEHQGKFFIFYVSKKPIAGVHPQNKLLPGCNKADVRIFAVKYKDFGQCTMFWSEVMPCYGLVVRRIHSRPRKTKANEAESMDRQSYALQGAIYTLVKRNSPDVVPNSSPSSLVVEGACTILAFSSTLKLQHNDRATGLVASSPSTKRPRKGMGDFGLDIEAHRRKAMQTSAMGQTLEGLTTSALAFGPHSRFQPNQIPFAPTASMPHQSFDPAATRAAAQWPTTIQSPSHWAHHVQQGSSSAHSSWPAGAVASPIAGYAYPNVQWRHPNAQPDQSQQAAHAAYVTGTSNTDLSEDASTSNAFGSQRMHQLQSFSQFPALSYDPSSSAQMPWSANSASDPYRSTDWYSQNQVHQQGSAMDFAQHGNGGMFPQQ